MIVDRLTRQSADMILAACFMDDGVDDVDPARSTPVDRALKRKTGIVQFKVGLDRPLIGLGASAPVYYPAIAGMLSAESVIPSEADVANAVGAVVGQVRATVTVFVTMPEDGVYIVNGAGESIRLANQEKAFILARDRASNAALNSAKANGADEPVLALLEDIQAPEIEGQKKLIEARFTAVASGRPRIAVH